MTGIDSGQILVRIYEWSFIIYNDESEYLFSDFHPFLAFASLERLNSYFLKKGNLVILIYKVKIILICERKSRQEDNSCIFIWVEY